MNSHHTHIAFVLDRSGSMDTCRETAISGFNAFLREQQEEEGLATLDLILFDDQYDMVYAALPVAEITPLDTETYIPRGSTALLDAIARTIDELGARFAAFPEASRPGQVVVAVLTDGLENASRRHSWHDVADRIRRQTDRYDWTFLFLGANQDAIATAAQINIAAHNSAAYAADEAGTAACVRSTSRKISALRRSKANPSASPSADLTKPLSEIQEEEDRRE